MIDFPSQVVVFISDLVQLLSQFLNFTVKSLSHALQPFFLLFLLPNRTFHSPDFLPYQLIYLFNRILFLGMMLLQRKVLGVQFLVNRRVNDLRVELFLIVMIVVYPPIDSLFAARWQADAMHIQSIEFWILLRQYPAQWHLSNLKLMFCIMTWSTSFAFVHFIIYIN